MAGSMSTEKIRLLIKSLLKREGKTYCDLALYLCITEAAVKRFMIKGEISIDRVSQIARYFRLTLVEFISMSDQLQFSPYQLNEKQEKLFEKKPILMYVFLLLGIGFSVNEVKVNCGLSEVKLKSILLALDKAALIELSVNDKIKVLGKAPYKLIPDGVLIKKYSSQFLKNIKSLISINKKESTLQEAFELYLSPNLLVQFKSDIRELLKKYRELSRIDHHINGATNLSPVSGIFFLTKYNAWKKTLLER